MRSAERQYLLDSEKKIHERMESSKQTIVCITPERKPQVRFPPGAAVLSQKVNYKTGNAGQFLPGGFFLIFADPFENSQDRKSVV